MELGYTIDDIYNLPDGQRAVTKDVRVHRIGLLKLCHLQAVYLIIIKNC